MTDSPDYRLAVADAVGVSSNAPISDRALAARLAEMHRDAAKRGLTVPVHRTRREHLLIAETLERSVK